jgi:hypothetical protein
MSIRKLTLLVATAAMGLLAVGFGSASATTLRADPGNTAFPAGNVTITNTSSSTATLTTALGNLTCESTRFHADVNQNGAATLTGRLTALTFTQCTDTIPVLTITSCHLHTPPVPTISITSTGGGTTGSVVLGDVVVRCAFAGTPNACYFTAATANGVATNATSTIQYNNVAAVGVSPTSDTLGALCPSTGTFGVTLRHIVQAGTNRTVTIAAS